MNDLNDFGFLANIRPTDEEIATESKAVEVIENVISLTTSASRESLRRVLAVAAAVIAIVAATSAIQGAKDSTTNEASMTSTTYTTLDSKPFSATAGAIPQVGNIEYTNSEVHFINTVNKELKDNLCRSRSVVEDLLNSNLSRFQLSQWKIDSKIENGLTTCATARIKSNTRTILITPQPKCTHKQTTNCHR